MNCETNIAALCSSLHQLDFNISITKNSSLIDRPGIDVHDWAGQRSAQIAVFRQSVVVYPLSTAPNRPTKLVRRGSSVLMVIRQQLTDGPSGLPGPGSCRAV